MLNPLPLSQWLSAPRPDDTPVAWQDDHLWTLGDLRHDVTQLVDTLRSEDGERWALCIENGYLFIVALLATLHAGKTPVLPGHSRAAQLNEQRALFSGVLSDTTLDFQGQQLRWRAAAAIKVQLIAHDQVIEINHQQGVFLFRVAHALKQILRTQPAFFFAAGGNEANTVTGRNVL